MQPKLDCTSTFWSDLIRELHRRGAERTEAGALLLGTTAVDGARKLEEAVYYDDIDPNSLSRGYVRLDRRRLGPLWAHARQRRLKVVADVHTHPGIALQSGSDRANPMMPRAGHLALIVPDYARKPLPVEAVGVFEYLGNRLWRTLSDCRSPRPVLRIQEYA